MGYDVDQSHWMNAKVEGPKTRSSEEAYWVIHFQFSLCVRCDEPNTYIMICSSEKIFSQLTHQDDGNCPMQSS